MRNISTGLLEILLVGGAIVGIWGIWLGDTQAMVAGLAGYAFTTSILGKHMKEDK